MTSGLPTPIHLVIVLVIVLFVYGPKRMPQTGRAIGRGLREFRDAVTARDQIDRTPLEPERPSSDQ